ncbi:hypothetical protein TNCV_352131 [Trichonephila clavipes]|nr:hypothetical protein TNCV_352131 [Trichonephila clavipes]
MSSGSYSASELRARLVSIRSDFLYECQNFCCICDLGLLSTTENNDWCRVRAHYEQLSEFERGRIIRLKKAVLSDESRFQLCPDDHRRRVWRRPVQHADSAFTLAHHTGQSTRSYGLGCHFF